MKVKLVGLDDGLDEDCNGTRVKGDSEAFGLSNWKDGERRASMFVREGWELGLSMSS